MLAQFNFFAEGNATAKNRLDGFDYQTALIEAPRGEALGAGVRDLPFQEFEFHGYKGKRRVVSFGWKYEFSGGGQLRQAGEIPEFLLSLRSRAAAFAKLEPDA